MELRRALLLFAVVLGVAAVATALSTATDQRGSSATPAATTDASAPSPAELVPGRAIRFDADRAPATKTINAGRAGKVLVTSDAPGEVTIPSLGLSATLEPGTPAVFDVYEAQPGRHRLQFEAPGAVRGRSLGVLAVRASR